MVAPLGLLAGVFLGLTGAEVALPAPPGGSTAADEAGLNKLSDEEKAAGWQLLFDGKSTHGWRKYKGKTVPDAWKVIDGALVLRHEPGKSEGDIVTVDEFGDFELSLEWKIAPGGNSGIMYRVTELDPVPWASGPEYQLLDNARHPDGRSPWTTAASCYALYAPSRDATRPVGEWNRTRIVAKGNHVEHWLNGEKVVTYELGSPDWKEHLRKSKFMRMPRFGIARRGHIDLQDHGDEVAFRNIKIRSLSAKDKK
jgi:hypothetical protein